MRIFRIAIVLFGLFILVLTSCKKSGKEVLEKITSETVEKTAKGVSKEGTEKTLKTLTRKELRSLDWDKLLMIIRHENLNLA